MSSNTNTESQQTQDNSYNSNDYVDDTSDWTEIKCDAEQRESKYGS
jgi:hypothetical protein